MAHAAPFNRLLASDFGPASCARTRRGATFGTFHGLDSPEAESYLRHIPIHRLPGGALVRASAFSLGRGHQASIWAWNERGIFWTSASKFPSATSTPVELKKGIKWLVLPG